MKDLSVLTWQSSAVDFLYVLLVHSLDSILLVVEARAIFCPVASFAIFEANSIWRFFDDHHL